MYHYTSIDVLEKIVNTKEIWASSAHYMNDTSELRYGIAQVRNRVSDRVSSRSDDTEGVMLMHLVSWISERVRQTFPFYLACFSEKRDDLNQWRSYAPGVKGVCIGFDSAQMHDCFREQGWDFMHVYYQRDSQLKWADVFIDRAIRAAERTLVETNSAPASHQPTPREKNIYVSAFESEIACLLEVASRIKHPAFAEEREWRLTSRLMDDQPPKRVGYRVGGSMMVPYFAFRVVPEKETILRLAEVIIPNTTSAKLAVQSMEAFLKMNDVRSPVNVSEVPYRLL